MFGSSWEQRLQTRFAPAFLNSARLHLAARAARPEFAALASELRSAAPRCARGSPPARRACPACVEGGFSRVGICASGGNWWIGRSLVLHDVVFLALLS
jgi:hypothetical protein